MNRKRKAAYSSVSWLDKEYPVGTVVWDIDGEDIGCSMGFHISMVDALLHEVPTVKRLKELAHEWVKEMSFIPPVDGDQFEVMGHLALHAAAHNLRRT